AGRIVVASALVLALRATASAEDRRPPAPAPTPEPGISDNSFLLEEAYNQERGVVQHINGLSRFGGADWVYTFTQERPVPAAQHQLSYTIAVLDAEQGPGFGDLALD